MKRLYIVIIVALFFSPILASSITDQPTEGDSSFDFDRIVYAHNNNMVEIAFDTVGDGVYLAFECDVELNIHIINSSARIAVLNHNPWSDVNDMSLLYRNEGNLKFKIPYDDTFYILFVNNEDDDSNLDGWYARDETGPSMEIQGIEEDQIFDYYSKVEISCRFREPYWNLAKLEFQYSGGHDDPIRYPLREFELEQQLYNWSVWIDFSDFSDTTPAFIFIGTDEFGNTREVSIQVMIINKPASTTTPPSPIGMMVVMFGVFGLCGGAAGINYLKVYLKEGKEGLKPKTSHRDKKRKKR